MKLNQVKLKVEARIDSLINSFKENPELFLTEQDVVAYLYKLLLEDFGSFQETADNPPRQSIPLHCEVRWYGGHRRRPLRYRSDLVILNVPSLITENTDSFRLPSKGYGFDKFQVIIEVKLRRKTRRSNSKWMDLIRKDRRKISRLRRSLTGANFLVYLIIFDKKSDIGLESRTYHSHKEYYVYPYENAQMP
jgi:hypothetical protein